jgi:hypothetical protein
MTGPQRRALQAERALNSCRGTPLVAAIICGWGRQPRHHKPDVAHAPGLDTADGPSGPRRLAPPRGGGGPGALARLLAVGLQRRGLRRRQVIQAQPQKQSAEPAALCDQSATKPHQRWPRSRSTGCVALVKRLGRAGRSPAGGGRGAILRPVSLPWGGKNRPRPGGWWRKTVAHSALTFGSAAKTRAGSGETLAAWGTAVEEAPQVALTRRQSPRDTGPARSGRRPQGWQRMVVCCEDHGPTDAAAVCHTLPEQGYSQ